MVALLVTIFVLAFRWNPVDSRDGVFYYFLCLLAYAIVMIFYSDLIFMGFKKPLHTRVPVFVVAIIHAAYLLLILLLKALLGGVSAVYFILASAIATSIQVAISMWIFSGMRHIEGQQGELDQRANARVMRELLLGDLQMAFKNIPALSGDAEVMRKLGILCDTWKTAAPQDTPNTVQITATIDTALRALIANAANTETVIGQMDYISSLIEQRKKLLALK